jgi:hypothetical protein
VTCIAAASILAKVRTTQALKRLTGVPENPMTPVGCYMQRLKALHAPWLEPQGCSPCCPPQSPALLPPFSAGVPSCCCVLAGNLFLTLSPLTPAQVTRDRIMAQLDAQYPQFGFGQHKVCARVLCIGTVDAATHIAAGRGFPGNGSPCGWCFSEFSTTRDGLASHMQ